MGNDMVQQAVEEAADDMGNVQAAADAISTAISNVTPWLDGQTWTGSAAKSWEGDWKSFYASVKNCLDELKSAEASIISSTQSQMEKLAAKQHQAA